MSAVKSKQLSIAITPEMRMNLNSAIPLFQGDQGAMLAQDGNYIVYALTNPNVSTPVHELAHIYENYLSDTEKRQILNWANKKEWDTSVSETFARGFEKYLATGKAPSTKLKTLFENFKNWLIEIYNRVTGSDIDVPITLEVKRIYDTMLLGDKAYKYKQNNSSRAKGYTVLFKDGKLLVRDQKGKIPSDPVVSDILRQYADDYDFTQGEKFPYQPGMSQQEYEENAPSKSNNPAELAEIALRTQTKSFIDDNIDQTLLSIIDLIKGKVKRGKKSDTYTGVRGAFLDYVGRYREGEYINQSNAATYLRADGTPIDALAQEVSEMVGREVTEQEIVDIIINYPNGENDVRKEVRDQYSNPAKQKFNEITGFPASDFYFEKAVQQAIDKEKLDKDLQNNYLNYYTDEEIAILVKEREQYEKTINQGNEGVYDPGNTQDSQEESRVPETSERTRRENQEPEEQINSVRDLANIDENGELSAGVFAMLEKGDTLNVGGKTYTVTTKTKPKKKKVKTRNGEVEVKAYTLRLKDEDGNNYSAEHYDGKWGQQWLRKGDTKKKDPWGQLSRDIQADITTDLLNENNRFHEVSDSYKLAEKYVESMKAERKGVMNSMKRNKNLVHEQIQPLRTAPKGKPKKLNKIIADVAKALKATVTYGSAGRGAAGFYRPSNALIRIENANNIQTVAHELGHSLDDRFKIREGTFGHENEIAIIKQLKWFSDRGGSNPPSNATKEFKTEYLEREGIAELIRSYVVNPVATRGVGSELLDYFLDRIDPETRQAIENFQQDVLNLYNASYGEKIDATVEDRIPKEELSTWEKFTSPFRDEKGRLNIHWLDKIKSNWTNSLHIANKAYRFGLELKGESIENQKPEDNFEITSRLLAGVDGRINRLIHRGLVDSRNRQVKDSKGNLINIDYLLEPFDNTSEETINEEMKEAIRLLIAERTIEYAKNLQRTDQLTGIGASLETDLEVASNYLSEWDKLKETNPEKHQRIKEAARRYRVFADAGLKYAVESGRISRETYKRIKDTNEYYVSLARTKEVVPGEDLEAFMNDSNKITSVKKVLYKAKGGTDMIHDPYLSLLHNTANFIKESDRNKVLNNFVEPFRNSRWMGEGDQIDLAQVAGQVTKSGDYTKTIFNNGKAEFWQFDKDIYNSLTGMESIPLREVYEWLGKPSDLIRFTVTNFPVFAARNAARDTMARLIVSRTQGNIADLYQTKENRELFEIYGGSQAGFYHQNKQAYIEDLNRATKRLTSKGGIILDPRKLTYRNYRKALERGENLNRVAEFNSGFRKAKKDGMDDYNAGLYAAFQARDLMDFAVAGHYMRVINKLIPFSNATVQSVKRNIKGAKENPGQFALRMAIYTLLPQLAMRALVAMSGDEEEYEELPDYQRDLFWNFKTPFTGDKWVSIPKPFELGLPSSFIDRAISKVRGNDKGFDGFGYMSYNTIQPFDIPSLTGPIRPIIESWMNKDSFRDRDIVPFWEKDKLMELREGTKYASRISRGLSDAFGFVGMEADPRKIDHIIKGYTTYFGNTVLSLGDIGDKNSKNQFDFTKTGFIKGQPISSSKSVTKAMKLAKEIGYDGSKMIDGLKGMVKMWYEMDGNKKAQNALQKAMYKYSKEVVIPELEKQKKIKLMEAKEKRRIQNMTK
jgi:hypothetical protein